MINFQSGIYGLKCPISGVVRYVGYSKNINHRYFSHISQAKYKLEWRKSPITDWINILGMYGLKPVLTILETCQEKDLKSREYFWIENLYYECNLLNVIRPNKNTKRIYIDWNLFGEGTYIKNPTITVNEVILSLKEQEYEKLYRNKTSLNINFYYP